jgi:hypothetical protein
LTSPPLKNGKSPKTLGKISTPSRKIEKVQKHLEKYPLQVGK